MASEIAKINDLLAAGLLKSGLTKGPTQQVIEEEGVALVAELVAVVRKRVEARSERVSRVVVLDSKRTNAQVIEATGRKEYLNKEVVASMPRADFVEGEVIFLPLRKSMSDKEVDEIIASYGLVPATPDAVAKVNQNDPAFADTHPNFAHWKNAKDNWCYATFGQWFDGERDVRVGCSDDDWRGRWWVGCVRKAVPSEL